MIIYQFIYIWPTSFTEYATVVVTWRVTPSGLRLKISGSNTQGMTPHLPAPPSCHIKMFSVCFQWCSFHHWQGFVQEISGKWLKKLNLLIEFWNSIFIKFYFKAYCNWTCIQKCFRGFTPNPNQSFAMDLLRSLQHLKMPTCIL